MRNKDIPFDILDDYPEPMKRYLSYYGWHFNKKAYEYAASLMWKEDTNGKKVKVAMLTKADVDNLLAQNGVTIENTGNYDYVYWAMQCKADLMPGAIDDPRHHAMYVKMMSEDADVTSEAAFRKWYITAVGSGIDVQFETFLEE